MDYCITTLLNQGVTGVPQWGQGHPYEIKTGAFQRTSSSSSSESYASAEGMSAVGDNYNILSLIFHYVRPYTKLIYIYGHSHSSPNIQLNPLGSLLIL